MRFLQKKNIYSKKAIQESYSFPSVQIAAKTKVTDKKANADYQDMIIPGEIWCVIFQFCDIQATLNLLKVNKALNEIARHNIFSSEEVFFRHLNNPVNNKCSDQYRKKFIEKEKKLEQERVEKEEKLKQRKIKKGLNIYGIFSLSLCCLSGFVVLGLPSFLLNYFQSIYVEDYRERMEGLLEAKENQTVPFACSREQYRRDHNNNSTSSEYTYCDRQSYTDGPFTFWLAEFASVAALFLGFIVIICGMYILKLNKKENQSEHNKKTTFLISCLFYGLISPPMIISGFIFSIIMPTFIPGWASHYANIAACCNFAKGSDMVDAPDSVFPLLPSITNISPYAVASFFACLGVLSSLACVFGSRKFIQFMENAKAKEEIGERSPLLSDTENQTQGMRQMGFA